MEKIAVIDLGSNSVRMVLANVLEGGYFVVFDELKETVRLSDDLEKDGYLKPVRITQAIKTLKMFRQLCDANNIEKIYAYATAAVRRAKNQKSFLDEVAVTSGIKLKVLSAEEETNLVYLGVVNSLDVSKGLIMEMGGGSTHLIYYCRKHLQYSETLPFGTISFIEKFADFKPEERAEKIYEFMTEKLKEIPWLSEVDPDAKFIGVGGVFRNLGKISRMYKKYPFNMAHNYVVSTSDFNSIYDSIKGLELDKTMKIKGLSSDRADIFPSALASMKAVIDFMNFENVTICGAGLREGVMFKHALPSVQDKPISDVLGHSLLTTVKYFDENLKHAEQVYNLSIQLFKQLKVLHKLPRQYVKVLRTASMLHDTGNRIKFYDHQKHSFYVICNSNLYGISHKDILLAAFVASLHRKSELLKTEFAKYREMFTDEDVDAMIKLGIILRIAESFDRSMSGAITAITCDVLGGSVIMKTESETDCTLEIKDALSCSGEFKKAFNKNLEIL